MLHHTHVFKHLATAKGKCHVICQYANMADADCKTDRERGTECVSMLLLYASEWISFFFKYQLRLHPSFVAISCSFMPRHQREHSCVTG